MPRSPRPFALLALLLPSLAHSATASRIATRFADAASWSHETLRALSPVRRDTSPVDAAGDLLALYVEAGDPALVRVSLVAPHGIVDGAKTFEAAGLALTILVDDGTPGSTTRLPSPLTGDAPFGWTRALRLEPGGERLTTWTPGAQARGLPAGDAAIHLDHGWLAAALPGAGAVRRIMVISSAPDGRELDRIVSDLSVNLPTGETNVAFMQHGNQGLAYSDVFAGRPGAEASSGFDEILRTHEQHDIPVNIHLSALLQSAAEWDRQNGSPLDFNGWLRAGVTAGWVGMVSSAYAQPIMPFLQGAMNDWALSRDHAMVQFRYGYDAHVAWVPERVFLDPSTYPNAGVIDWSGAHWQANGTQAVILDDAPHLQGHNKHQIHTLQGNGLRMIPRDGDFTGRLHVGDGQGALDILVNEANSGVGQYRLTLYADDWEQAAEVAGWQDTYPNALETYQWMIDKCATESAWLHTWKLDPAIANPDFNGDTFTPTYATYGGIGDVNGYGGNNNAWYTDWAGYVPYSTGGNGSGACGGTGNCRNHGQLWNDAHAALQAAPDNGIRETGWYVLMTNLHETAWHDYLGGPISGWQRQYSGHLKNASVYAEAARWAGGQYANPTGAYLSDIDDDGVQELVMYNDRVLAVFESIGGRATQVFTRNGSQACSVVGIDNAYWAGTEGDYNDVNHVGALSDVSPNQQHDLYSMQVDAGSGGTVQATFTHGNVRKTVRLTLGDAHLDCIYRVGANTEYVQAGFSPDVVDLLYNARMDRIWGGGPATYAGQRNPNTGATAAFVLGGGGATHNLEFARTLMKADEIRGTQKFEFYLYAGPTSAPDGNGHVSELEGLAAQLTDALPPEAQRATYFPATHDLVITFDEAVATAPVGVTGIAIDANDDGTADVTLDAGCTVTSVAASPTLTIHCSAAVHAAIQALPSRNALELVLAAGAVRDVAGNPAAALTSAGNVPVSYGPPTRITLDGRFDPAEWPTCGIAVADSGDSQWNPPNLVENEIQAVYATWDSTYLYLGLRGVVTGNSWLLYLDTDPGGPAGQTDLTAIDAWERGATFTAPGFKPDWEFGAYQHQGPFDSQSFFKLLSPTTTANRTDSILTAFDPTHAHGVQGGSELAIPWSVLYGLGTGRVPAHAALGLVASLAYDPEPTGQLGGDQAPNNLAAVAPVIDNRVLVTIDADGDGFPDPIDRTPPTLLSAATSAPAVDSVITLTFSEPVAAAVAQQASRYTVYQTANPTATLTVRSATRLGNPAQVRLVVSPMSYVGYTVVAGGIADTACAMNVAAQTSATFQGPPVAVEPGGTSPRTLALEPVWPNPVRGGRLGVTWSVPTGDDAAGVVDVALLDLGGRRVRTVAHGPQTAGRYALTIDARDDRGQRLAPGVYFVRVSRGSSQAIRRVIVMR